MYWSGRALTIATNEEGYKVPCSSLEDLEGMEESDTTEEYGKDDSSGGRRIIMVEFKSVIRVTHSDSWISPCEA